MKSLNAILRQNSSLFNTTLGRYASSNSDAASSLRCQKEDDAKSELKGSLIPETLKQMEEDDELQKIETDLKKFGQAKLTREERKKRQRALNNLGVPNFIDHIINEKKKVGISMTEPFLRGQEVELIQMNISRFCNQACTHCLVESSPKRTETMSRETVDRCLEVLGNSPQVKALMITGGAPELCMHFRYLATEAKKLGVVVVDCCNLTALLEPGQEDTAQFLADNKIHILASMPGYTDESVTKQRGGGVFNKSVEALLLLNSLGYGKPETGLQLDLVYTPNGAFLPEPTDELEATFKVELDKRFGIVFTRLIALPNTPVKRFADYLHKKNEMENYMSSLVENFNLDSVESLWCRDVVNISWDGKLYGCEANQQLDLPLQLADVPDTMQRARDLTIWDIATTDDVFGRKICTDSHCFACSASKPGTGCNKNICTIL